MVLVDIYADEGITGTVIEKRDEFKRLIKDCKNKKIDRVLVKSVTRFARNSLECIETVRALKSYGTSIFFENDNIDTERMNSEMILYIKSAFAQNESMSASKRMQTSYRMRMADGTFNTTNAPYGYRLISGKLIVVESEAENVREIFNLYLSGMGANKIFYTMLSRGIKDLSTNQIRYILSNEKYMGDSIFQKYYTPMVLPLRTKENRGELPKYHYEATHEPIVSKELFDRVQEIIKQKATRTEKVNKNEFYSGKIRCRHCGWVYKKITRNSGRYWVCSKKSLRNAECHSSSYSDAELDNAFVIMINTLKANSKVLVDETLSQLIALKTKINKGNNAITEIDIEVASLGEQKNMYTELYTSKIIPDIIYFEKVDRLERQIAELRSRRLKLLNEDEEESCIEKLRELQRVLSCIDGLRGMDEDLFSQIVKTIYIEENGSITFKLKCELEFHIRRQKQWLTGRSVLAMA